MPRPLGYMLPGGENTTKGQRGLADISVNTSNPTAQLNNTALNNDLPPTLDQSFLDVLNGPVVAGAGADMTASGASLSNMVSALEGTQASSSTGWIVLGAIAVGLFLLVKK